MEAESEGVTDIGKHGPRPAGIESVLLMPVWAN